MDWQLCITIILSLGALFFLSGICVLFWCAKHGHFANFDKQAKIIFDEEEPEGVQTDFFPGEQEIS